MTLSGRRVVHGVCVASSRKRNAQRVTCTSVGSGLERHVLTGLSAWLGFAREGRVLRTGDSSFFSWGERDSYPVFLSLYFRDFANFAECCDFELETIPRFAITAKNCLDKMTLRFRELAKHRGQFR
jgi:hypothetical protein